MSCRPSSRYWLWASGAMVLQMRNCLRIWFINRWLQRFQEEMSPDRRWMVMSKAWMSWSPVGLDLSCTVWLTPRSKGASQMVVLMVYPSP